ncbi:MAG: hypothetical protein HY881_22805 [Deltaproteobacteria bacterium]|nr:hypothetical protein [Deltaproteobacteria bacterium]
MENIIKEKLDSRKFQDERDAIVLKKLESGEQFDDGEKAELIMRFTNYPEVLNELTLLRQVHNLLLGQRRKTHSKQ